MSDPTLDIAPIEWTNSDGFRWRATFTESATLQYFAERPQDENLDIHRVRVWEARCTDGVLDGDHETILGGLAWNEAGDSAEIGAAIRQAITAACIYNVGTQRVRGTPGFQPITYPLYAGLIAMVLGGTYTGLRMLGACAPLRVICGGEDINTIDTWMPPIGVKPPYAGGGGGPS